MVVTEAAGITISRFYVEHFVSNRFPMNMNNMNFPWRSVMTIMSLNDNLLHHSMMKNFMIISGAFERRLKFS
jgi:hypothetical protein